MTNTGILLIKTQWPCSTGRRCHCAHTTYEKMNRYIVRLPKWFGGTFLVLLFEIQWWPVDSPKGLTIWKHFHCILTSSWTTSIFWFFFTETYSCLRLNNLPIPQISWLHHCSLGMWEWFNSTLYNELYRLVRDPWYYIVWSLFVWFWHSWYWLLCCVLLVCCVGQWKRYLKKISKLIIVTCFAIWYEAQRRCWRLTCNIWNLCIICVHDCVYIQDNHVYM